MSTEFLRSKHDRQQILNTFYGRPLSLLFFFYICGYRYFGNGGTDRREILHDGIPLPDTKSPLLGAVLRGGTPNSQILGLNFSYLTAIISKTVTRRVSCQLQLNISSTAAF